MQSWNHCPGYSSSAKGGHSSWSVVVDPGQQPCTHPAPCLIPSSVDGEKIEGRQKGSWAEALTSTGKANAAPTRKVQRGFHALLPISWQVFVHLLESRISLQVLWKDKCHDLLPPYFPGLLLQSTMAHGLECAFSQFGWAVLAVTALRLMPIPGKQPENLSAVQCSAAAETLLCYWHWPWHKPKHIIIEALVWWFLMMDEIMWGKNPCYVEEDTLKATT